MTYPVKMPRLGLKMSSGVIVKWLRKEGEAVKKGSDLLEIETEKVSYVMKSPRSGILYKILVSEMAKVPVNQTIALIGDGRKPPHVKTSSSPKSKKREKKKIV